MYIPVMLQVMSVCQMFNSFMTCSDKSPHCIPSLGLAEGVLFSYMQSWSSSLLYRVQCHLQTLMTVGYTVVDDKGPGKNPCGAQKIVYKDLVHFFSSHNVL